MEYEDAFEEGIRDIVEMVKDAMSELKRIKEVLK